MEKITSKHIDRDSAQTDKNDGQVLSDEVTSSESEPEQTDNPSETKEKASEKKDRIKAPNKTRKDLQIPRRVFHFTCGLMSGLIYQVFLTHQQAVYILGIATSVLYVLEQLRINYPNAGYLKQVNQYFLYYFPFLMLF